MCGLRVSSVRSEGLHRFPAKEERQTAKTVVRKKRVLAMKKRSRRNATGGFAVSESCVIVIRSSARDSHMSDSQ